ncbi:pH-response regulator protein palH/RIM21 [Spathaspora sp. JA1]|nr:pH-response regulator protein palH/RIM21 [Spathaspora sp. JA1]
MLVSNNYNNLVQYVQNAIYQQVCYLGKSPMMNTNTGMVIEKFSEPLPLIRQSWNDFTRNNLRGDFSYSVVPIVYAIAVSAVIIWFLTIFVFTNYTIKPSMLLRASSLLSSIYILITIIKSIIILHGQQRNAFLYGAQLLQELNSNKAINIVDVIIILLLQINQVQVIMRFFSRQSDKRLTFYVGVIASITSQTIWGVSIFHNFSPNNEAGDILPAFIYLVRIAMGLCYAAIITVFFVTKIQFIIANKSIWLLTLLTFLLIYSPVAFFIADVSNAFIYELSDIFSVVTYMICVVIPWEWCNKYNLLMKMKEKEGVLGRRFYEDEVYELDRFELFVEEMVHESDEDNGGGGQGERLISNDQNEVSEGSNDRTQRGPSRKAGGEVVVTEVSNEISTTAKVLSALEKSKVAFLTFTDDIIATGFAIPRSVSVSTQSIAARIRDGELAPQFKEPIFTSGTTSEPFEGSSRTAGSGTNINVPRADSVPVQNTTRNRRNVYIYSRKEVVLDQDDYDE